MNYLYLLINFCTILIPFVFTFHPKIRFYKTWRAFFPAVVVVGIIFIIWDSYFTSGGIWGFNESYVSGMYVAGLPIEEILFFLCIPYACVFTYFCLTKFYTLEWNPKAENIFCLLFSFTLLTVGIIYLDRIYTSSAFISTAIVSLLLRFVGKIRWFGKAVTVYAILLIPFFIVNGILTGTGLEGPVVWYNNNEIFGIRLLTIPVEDIIYGFELILLNIYGFEYLRYYHSTREITKIHLSPEQVDL